MQRITNCIVKNDQQVLLLQKPSKGWWVAPGGKMESGESVKASVVREYQEETGLVLLNPDVKGIFTIVIKEDDQVVDEWMMHTFLATEIEGELLQESPEGKLQWQEVDTIEKLPMAAGDRFIFQHILHSTEIIYGTFHYTKDYQLLSYQLATAAKSL